MRNTYTLAAAATAIGLVASGCGANSSTQATAATTTTAASSASSTVPSSAAATSTQGGEPELQSLIPVPPDTQVTKGPDAIPDNGVHMHFQANGAPGAVMDAYKAALQGQGWTVTTIITSGNSGGGGGATYTGTHGDAYGVFDGGGFNSTTYLDICTWLAKPENPNCTRGDR